MSLFISTQFGEISLPNSVNGQQIVEYSANSAFGTTIEFESKKLKLADHASSIDNYYHGLVIEILRDGVIEINRELYVIISYDGTTKIAEIDISPNVKLDSTFEYIIHPNSGRVIEGSRNYAVLDGKSLDVDNRYKNCYIELVEYRDFSANSRDFTFLKIAEYIGKEHKAVFEKFSDLILDSNYLYIIYGEAGSFSVTNSDNKLLQLSDLSEHVKVGNCIELNYDNQFRFSEIIEIDLDNKRVKIKDEMDSSVSNASINNFNIFSGWYGKNFDNISGYQIISTSFNFDSFKLNGKLINLYMQEKNSRNYDDYTVSINYRSTEQSNRSDLTYGIPRFILFTRTATVNITSLYHTEDNVYKRNLVNGQISDQSSIKLNKSVITGRGSNGLYKNVSVDFNNSLNVNLQNSKSAFGELMIVELTPLIQLKFPYDVFTNSVNIYNSLGASIKRDEYSNVLIKSGSELGSTAIMDTKDIVEYRSGEGVDMRFTVIYQNCGVGDAYIGIGDDENGFFIGYYNGEFGVLRKYNGLFEIRSIFFTRGCKKTGTIKIGLNSPDEPITILLDKSEHMSPGEVARAVAETDFSSHGFRTVRSGGRVYFIGDKTGARDGNYGFDAGVTGVQPSGTIAFTRDRAGKESNVQFIRQRDWNFDKGFGTGVLPNINYSNGNLYRITYQWLGYGAITFYMESNIFGEFIPLHQIKYTNQFNTPSVAQPSGRLTMVSSNKRLCSDEEMNDTGSIIQVSSLSAFIQGRIADSKTRYSDVYSVRVQDRNKVLFVFRAKYLINNVINKEMINFDRFNFTNFSRRYMVEFSIHLNPQVNVVNTKKKMEFEKIDDNSIIESFKPAGGDGFYQRNGKLIYNVTVAPNNTNNIDNSDIILRPDDLLVVSAEVLVDETENGSGSDNDNDISVRVKCFASWLENA